MASRVRPGLTGQAIEPPSLPLRTLSLRTFPLLEGRHWAILWSTAVDAVAYLEMLGNELGYILRSFLLGCLALKWALVYIASALPDSARACVGGFLSGSLGAAGSASWWWVGPAIYVDFSVVFFVVRNYKEDLETARGIALGYFFLNASAMIFARYSTNSDFLEYTCSILSFFLTGIISLIMLSMTFWFPIILYVAVRHTTWWK